MHLYVVGVVCFLMRRIESVAYVFDFEQGW